MSDHVRDLGRAAEITCYATFLLDQLRDVCASQQAFGSRSAIRSGTPKQVTSCHVGWLHRPSHIADELGQGLIGNDCAGRDGDDQNRTQASEFLFQPLCFEGRQRLGRCIGQILQEVPGTFPEVLTPQGGDVGSRAEAVGSARSGLHDQLCG